MYLGQIHPDGAQQGVESEAKPRLGLEDPFRLAKSLCVCLLQQTSFAT